MHPSVAEMKKVARTVRKEREGVLNWFTSRSTNAFLEGVNSVVQSIKRAARGFKNLGGLRDDGLDSQLQPNSSLTQPYMCG